MSATVYLPSRFTFASLPSFTSQIVGTDGHPKADQFTFDFSSLNFIDGSGMTVISNTMEWLDYRKVKMFFSGHKRPHVDCISYLDDCGFFHRHLGESVRPHARVRSTTLPFTKVAHADAHNWLEASFTPFMCNALGVQSGALASIRSCVGEIFNNIQDHSTLNIGFAHVQRYPNMKRVVVTISDFGRGIPNSMRQRHPGLTDTEAVLRATEEGITSQTTPRNRGLGLDLLIRRVTGNSGYVTIYSFNGAISCSSDDYGNIVKTPIMGNGAYPGTLVEISLRTDCFVGDDFEEEDMQW